ncbi:MAG: tRNA (adenosine(37)-N6)-threonylcarbamoyltransferase complex ATPase subunit type 1 TsaE [Paludibacteraceae bacterium]
MTILEIKNIETIRFTVLQFLAFVNSHKNTIYCFNGKMGAGKTTFIKALCDELGVNETVNSPTFSIINEYETKDQKIIYHFDCYRLNKIEDALNIGAEDYLNSGNICFIEWPEVLSPILPDNAIFIEIEEIDGGIRMLTIHEP